MIIFTTSRTWLVCFSVLSPYVDVCSLSLADEYIYTYIERERERDFYIHIYIYVRLSSMKHCFLCKAYRYVLYIILLYYIYIIDMSWMEHIK